MSTSANGNGHLVDSGVDPHDASSLPVMASTSPANGDALDADCLPAPDSRLTDALREDARAEQGDAPHPALAQDEIQRILEALLFVSSEPVSLERMVSAVGSGVARAHIQQALQLLRAEYEHHARGVRIAEIAGGYLVVTRAEYAPYIRRLTKTKQTAKLSRSALEALAIVSYKQPITRLDIENMRGVETSGVLKTLLDQKLVRIVGRQEVPGRPILYGTSKHFLQRFGLRDLRDLPPLKEIQDLGSSDTLNLPFDGASSEEASVHTDDVDHTA